MAEELICKVAKTLEEVTHLVEARFEHATDMDGCKLFRNVRKSLGGSSASLV